MVLCLDNFDDLFGLKNVIYIIFSQINKEFRINMSLVILECSLLFLLMFFIWNIVKQIRRNHYVYPYQKTFCPILLLIYLFLCEYCIKKSFEYRNSYRPIHFHIHNQREIINVIVGVGCINENISQGRSYYQVSVEISQCFFSRTLPVNGHGGIIKVFEGSMSMSVSDSMFYSCSSYYWGGAIFFSSSNNSILKRICALKCYASAYQHFAYLFSSQINQVEYLSLASCSNTTSGYRSVSILSGKQRVNYSNFSMNNAIKHSTITFDHPDSLSSSFCTFSNNNVSENICIYFFICSGSLSFANIVNNNSPSNFGIMCSKQGSPQIQYCIFSQNENTLFCIISGSLEVSHSYLSHLSDFSTSTAVLTTNNNSFTNKQTYQIHFSNSHYCHAEMFTETKKMGLIFLICIPFFVFFVLYFYIFVWDRKNNGEHSNYETVY